MILAALATVTVASVLQQLSIAVPSIIVATNTLTAAIHGIFNIQNPKIVHIVSWVLGVVTGLLFVLCNGLTFGLAPWADYLVGGVAGLIAGAASNGVYDWEKIKNLLDLITNLFGNAVHKEKFYRAVKSKDNV